MTILHPTDFSECAERAQGQAVRLARALEADLVLLHVALEAPLYREGFANMQEVRRVYDAQREWARAAIEERAAQAGAGGITTVTRLVVGVPHERIVAIAREIGADLIVMGTHGRGGLERFLLGSVTDRVVRTAPCPVVTVRLPPNAGRIRSEGGD